MLPTLQGGQRSGVLASGSYGCESHGARPGGPVELVAWYPLGRRVRTRTNGGVAGVSGRPLPLCQSTSFKIRDSKHIELSSVDHLTSHRILFSLK